MATFKRVLAIREKTLPPDHPEIAESLNNLATLYKDEGNYKEAVPLYTRCIEIVEKTEGPNSPHAATVLLHLAEILKKTGREKAGAEMEQKATAILSMKR